MHFLIVRCTETPILASMKTLHLLPAVLLRRVLLALMLVGLCAATPAVAAQTLGAKEIREILGGNTVMWNLGKVTQRQYFNAKGYTVFEDENFSIDKGLWTVTSDGLFCSNWKQTGWTCYRLALDGATLIWSGPISPFGSDEGERVVSRLMRGNQTTFSAPQGVQGDHLVATVARELDAGMLP
jgi:hypothetical protein